MQETALFRDFLYFGTYLHSIVVVEYLYIENSWYGIVTVLVKNAVPVHSWYDVL